MKCVNSTCKGRIFTPIRQSAITDDLQTIRYETRSTNHLCRIQEIDSDLSNDPGRIPRSIECQCTGDLVDACIPGEIVHITGIVKVFDHDVENEKSRVRAWKHL